MNLVRTSTLRVAVWVECAAVSYRLRLRPAIAKWVRNGPEARVWRREFLQTRKDAAVCLEEVQQRLRTTFRGYRGEAYDPE